MKIIFLLTFMISIASHMAFAKIGYAEEDMIKWFKFEGAAGISRQEADAIARNILTQQFATKEEMDTEKERLSESTATFSYSYSYFIPTIPEPMMQFYEVYNGGELKQLRRNNESVYFWPIAQFKRAEGIVDWLELAESKIIKKIFGKSQPIGLNDYFRFGVDEHSADNGYGGFYINLNSNSKDFGTILIYRSSDEPLINQKLKNFTELIKELNDSELYAWGDKFCPGPTNFLNEWERIKR